ncbi:hypothetical protein M5K25_001708 [Dendrobium thyrsiflorum]|uniref:BZIP domain-containing protein n=1 Tax=Dendrobium thyrsiflorum TaxID=117978 RepID=A0ABD0W237_DENTH
MTVVHLMPPYGTPPPYVMYPHGGIYAHPTMAPGSLPFSPYAMASPNGNAEASGAFPGSEAEGKSSEGKEKSPIKRSKGSLGSLNLITGKNSELGKTSAASGNGAYSQSGDSGSEASSEGSDANSQNDSPQKAGDAQNSSDGRHMETFPVTSIFVVDLSSVTHQNDNYAHGTTAHGLQNGTARGPSQSMVGQTMAIVPMPTGTVTGPTTNLNIGMDFWGATNPSTIPPIHGKVPATAVATPMIPGATSELWMQLDGYANAGFSDGNDEREIKRQKRKQSNRESARRSRLRKQAECEELAHRVEVLKEENASLRAEVNRIKKEHEQLILQNASLKERLGEIPKGTKELSHENPAEDFLEQNLDSDGKGREADAGRN